MAVFEVKLKATVTDTFRVIAENEYEAAERAELIFRNDNGSDLLDACFVVRPTESSHQSPVTSHQSPVTSHQSPVTSHQSPVTSHQKTQRL